MEATESKQESYNSVTDEQGNAHSGTQMISSKGSKNRSLPLEFDEMDNSGEDDSGTKVKRRDII